MNEYELLLLIVGGGVAVPTTVFVIARHLVLRDNPRAAREARVVGHLQVANAEARRQATQRAREMAR
ncbi:hypothetical protein ACGFH8_11900 [Micromonospora sp. NPDC049175]|uniref:hypothetical protein n=1 Tax=Micromonospora sp. NPDC049175 TaxID=3364266 RepID=UPI003714A688